MRYFVLEPDSSFFDFARSAFGRVKSTILAALLGSGEVNRSSDGGIYRYVFGDVEDIALYIITRINEIKVQEGLDELENFTVYVTKDNEVINVLIDLQLSDGSGGTVGLNIT